MDGSPKAALAGAFMGYMNNVAGTAQQSLQV
jgi:hypothetical protein